jgi:hypothetical protein
MAEYVPLTSSSLSEHEDEEFEYLKPGSQLPQHSGNLDVKNHTTLVWYSILAAIMAISAAAVFHMCVSLTTSGLEPLRSPDDITAALRMARPSPNLQEGRAILQQKHSKGEFC